MKKSLKQNRGVTMVALVVTVIMLIILANVLVFNTQDSIYTKKLNNLYNDLEILRNKVEEYYNEYGKIPASIEYKNINELEEVLSKNNDTGKFYVIDLEAMQGITLNYGREYESVKNDADNIYTDIYIINENSHNIFYVKGIQIKQNSQIKNYYTDYITPDETAVDLRYIDGIMIPDGYYYIGKSKDESGNEYIVISNNKEEINNTKVNQYTWISQVSTLTDVPSDITLESTQNKYDFLDSVNIYKGYFKNSEGKVQYYVIDEDKWSEPYTKETEYTDRRGDTVKIPQNFRVSLAPTMNTVANGLVVKDSNNNEWVWIQVPQTVFKKTLGDTDYENIEADLIEYAKDYRNGSSTQNLDWRDEYYEGCGIEATDEKTAEQVYEEMYQKMLSSVYTNGGFWISRYEAGIAGSDTDLSLARTSYTAITSTSPKAVSQKDMIPYNFVTCGEAQKLASQMSADSTKTSSLLFGIQWDLTCKFLEENSMLTKSDINTDSSNWGNYSNITFDITSKNAKQYTSSWSNITGSKGKSAILLSTGASGYTNVLNIYDFAGNEWEWTLEHWSNSSSPSVLRGGAFSNLGNVNQASSRGNNSKSNSVYYVFRSTLY